MLGKMPSLILERVIAIRTLGESGFNKKCLTQTFDKFHPTLTLTV